MESAAEDGDWVKMTELDVQFHVTLVEATGSVRLQRVFRTLIAETRICMLALKPAYTNIRNLPSEHQALVDILADGDEGKAVVATQAHLESAVNALTTHTSAHSARRS
jgi:DNA-binding GntR family transcriptional regulator